MTRKRIRFWLKLLLGAIAVFVALFAVGALVVAPRVEPAVRGQVIAYLENKFGSRLEMERLSLTVFPEVEVLVEGLALYHKGRTDVPPLVRMQWLLAEVDLREVFSKPVSVKRVRMGGLEITVPPRGMKRLEAVAQGKPREKKPPPEFVIESIDADGAMVRIMPKQAWKSPLEFDLRKLRLQRASAHEPMLFQALLHNPTPPGMVQTEGRFGPWASDDPGQSPVSGHYAFEQADLGHFKGIGGILSSIGDYDGPLERIVVDGAADVPRFRLSAVNQPIHLQTKFHAIVDGTNGDTWLEPVEAVLGRTRFVCRGGIVSKRGVKGKTLDLEVDAPQGRLRDYLQLAAKAEKPAITGDIRFDARLVIPPGEPDVVDRILIAGKFNVDEASLGNKLLQEKMGEISRRARGINAKEEVWLPKEQVATNFSGQFDLRDGRLSLADLRFAIPGAVVEMDGSYGLRAGELDFSGEALLDAKLSQMTSGVKSILLRAADPLFRRKGKGTVLPLRIRGTRDDPKFGIDVKRTLLRR